MSRGIQITQLKAQIAAAQQRINADMKALTTANANYQAAVNAQNAAGSYTPSSPQVTANTPVTNAVNPYVSSQTNAQNTAQNNVNSDQSAINQTNSDITTLDNQMTTGGINAAGLARWKQLQQQLHQQQQKLKSDQHALYAATANADAGKTVTYGQQAQADQTTVNNDASNLKKLGVTVDTNTGKPTNKTLTAQQQAAYYKYLSDVAKLNADVAMINQAQAQLQLYASDPGKYGSAASDAINNVNNILSNVVLTNNQGQQYTLQLNHITGINPKKAQDQLNQANQTLAYADASWNAITDYITYADASQKLTALQNQCPSNLKQLLPQAQLAVLQAKANYDQASSYVAMLTDQQVLAQAQTAYNANPNSTTKLALTQAQQQLNIDTQYFLAGSAEVYMASQAANVTHLQQQITQYQQKYMVCLSLDSPLEVQLAQAETALQSAKLVYNNLNTGASYLQSNLTVSTINSAVTAQLQQVAATQNSYDQWQKAHPTAPASANPYAAQLAKQKGDLTTLQQGLSYAQTQQDVAQYELLNSQFLLTLPSNLLNPQSQQDQTTLQSAYAAFFNAHPTALSDSNVASQLSDLQSPGQKVDVRQGIKEVQAFLKQEEQNLADRSMLQQGADWVGGLFGNSRSQLEDTLNGDLAALKALQANQNKMSAADFNAAYLKIMGNLSTQFDTQSQQELQTQHDWSGAQDVVRDVVAVTAAIAVSAASLGTMTPLAAALVGGTVGFTVMEGADTAQNIDTAAGGGDVNTNDNISLLTPMTDNWGHGGVTGQEWAHAGVDTAMNAVVAYTSAAGAAYGGVASTVLQARTIPTILAAFGVDSLEIAPEDATFQALSQVAAANAKNATLGLLVRASSGAAGMTVSQVFMQGGQIVSTGIDVSYNEATGQMTSAQAQKAMESAFESALFNVATAPIVGAAGGVVPQKFWPQLAVNGGTNAFLTFGTDFATHKSVDGNDWLSFALNTAMGMALHVMNEHGDEHVNAGSVSESTAGQPAVSPNDFTYDPETGIVKAIVNGEQITARLLRGGPQQLSASDVAVPGEYWGGKAFAIYEKGNGGYGIKPIVSLTANEETPALWAGQGTPPSAAQIQAGDKYYNVYQATPQNPVFGLTNGEYVVIPRVAGGSATPEESSPRPENVSQQFQQLPLWDPAVFPVSEDLTAVAPAVEAETAQTDAPQRGAAAAQQLPLWEPTAVPVTGDVTTAADQTQASPSQSKNFHDWPVKGEAPNSPKGLTRLKTLMFWGRNPPGPTFTPETYDALRQKLLASGQIAGDYPASYAAFKVDDHTVLLAWLPETPGDTDIHFHTYTFSQTFSNKGHPGAFDDFLRSLNLPKGVEEFLGKDNLTNYAFNVAKMVTPGSEVSLGPVPYYCGVFQGHYTGAEIQQILMTNLAQLDNRTARDVQQVSEISKPADAQNPSNPSDKLPVLDDNNLPVQNPDNPAGSTLPFDLSSLQKFELRARLHGTIVAVDLSGKGPDLVQAVLKLLQDHPLLFAHFGELTLNKEHVGVQRGQFDYQTFRTLLIWLRDQGLGKVFTVIHNDWSRVGTDPNNKRPLTVKGSYENLVEAVKFWTDPELKDLVQPVFAHTGIGRTSRGSDVPTPELTFEYYDSNGILQTETRGFADHIEVMRFLKEKIPNLVFDFSWNDVTKNYIESPVLGQKFLEWVLEDNPSLPKEQQNRFSMTIGSDSVRPVLLQQKNQGINTFLPILADLARSGPIGEEAVLNLVVRNYARLIDDAYGQQVAWWENNKGTAGFDEQKYNAAKAEFDLLQTIRNGLRDDQGNLIPGPDGQTPVWEGSRAYLEQKWTAWIEKVKSKGEVDPSRLNNPGFLVSLFRDTPDPHLQPEPPHSSDPPVDKWWKNPVAYAAWSWNDGWLRRGELTAGGAKNNPADSPDPITQAAVKKLRASSWLLGAAAVGMTAADAHFFAGMPLGRILSEAGFVTRGAQFLARDTWNENVRVFRENLTEQGHLTPEALEEFVNPIWRAAKERDFSDLQLFNVAGTTLQFWADYKDLRDRPIETGPDATWTASARGQAILAQVGEFTSTLASILNVDPASLSPFASTAPWGIQMRVAVLLSYMANVGYAFGTTVGTNIMTDLTPTDHTNPVVFATKVAFGITNAIAGAWTLEGLAGGIAGRNMEGHPWLQKAQALIQAAFTADGVIWASGQGWQTVTDIVMNHGPVTSLADVIELTGILAWTYAANRNRVAADAVVSGKAQPHTYEAWKTVAIMAVGLAVTQVMNELISDGVTKAGDKGVDTLFGDIFKWIQSIDKQQTPKVTPTPAYTPSPTPGYSPTPTAKYTPTPTPVTIPLPHHQ